MAHSDILYNIIGFLQKDICPIYSESDFLEDVDAISQACNVKLEINITRDKLPNLYTQDYACQMTGIKKSELAPFRTIYTNTKRKKHPKALGKKVRNFMLKKFKGNVVDWILSLCNENKEYKIEKWYIEAFMPFASDKSIPCHDLRAGYAELSKYDLYPSQHLSDFIRSHKDNFFNGYLHLREVIDDIIDTFSSNSSRKKRCIEMFDRELYKNKISEALATLDDNAYCKGVIQKCKMIREQHPIAYMSPIQLDAFIKFIVSKDNYKNVPHHFNSISIDSVINEVCDKMNLDEDDKRFIKNSKNMNTAIEEAESRQLLVQDFLAYDITPYIDYDCYIHDLQDNKSTFTKANIDALIGFSRSIEIRCPYEWRTLFDNIAELDEALKDKNLQLRSDSRLCAEYIETGKYYGPEFEEAEGDALESVVLMMEEMDFLFKNTKYREYIDYYDSEEAKQFAIYKFKETETCHIPNRLKTILANIDGSFEERYEKLERRITDYNTYDYYDRSSDWDSDSGSDDEYRYR